tara:strand:- start:81 stop:278 length:198 start_codon:yes stop_codon:yes gene_type:complete
MIDIDEYIEMWDNKLLGSVGVNHLMKALIAEVKRLRQLNNYLWEHRSSHWSADDDAEMDRLEMLE